MIFLILAFGTLGISVYSQTKLNEGSRVVDARLALEGHQVSGDYIIITYEIPFSGMVEIRLINKEGEKIWQSQYDQKYGKNQIVLKSAKFTPGELYLYQLNYKQDEVTSHIILEGGVD